MNNPYKYTPWKTHRCLRDNCENERYLSSQYICDICYEKLLAGEISFREYEYIIALENKNPMVEEAKEEAKEKAKEEIEKLDKKYRVDWVDQLLKIGSLFAFFHLLD